MVERHLARQALRPLEVRRVRFQSVHVRKTARETHVSSSSSDLLVVQSSSPCHDATPQPAKRPCTEQDVGSSPTPAHAPAAKRPRTDQKTGVTTPKRPIPRRRIAPREMTLGPRSPSALSPFRSLAARSRLQGRTPPRSPGGMWRQGEHGVTAAEALAPPSILVSPPAADIEAVIAKSTRGCRALRRIPIRHEWQFAFASTLLTRDQAALEQLQWQLDLAFASLSGAPTRDAVLVHHPRLAVRLARQSAGKVMSIVMRAWKPSTSTEYACSPPSFRLASLARESLDAAGASGAAHAAWAQQISAVLGADTAEKIAVHLVQTLWYMVAQYVAWLTQRLCTSLLTPAPPGAVLCRVAQAPRQVGGRRGTQRNTPAPAALDRAPPSGRGAGLGVHVDGLAPHLCPGTAYQAVRGAHDHEARCSDVGRAAGTGAAGRQQTACLASGRHGHAGCCTLYGRTLLC